MPDILTYKINGEVYDIPEDKVSSFLEKYPDAAEVESFTIGKDTFDIPQEKVQAFQKQYPDAQPLFSDVAPTTYPNRDTIVNEIDQIVPESDAEGLISESFKKGAEWVGRSGLWNSALFRGFLAQGMIESHMESSGSSNLGEGMDLYREEAKKQREKINEHDPNTLENASAFVLSMSLDYPLFAGLGFPGKGASMLTLRGLKATKNFWLRQGLPLAKANKVTAKGAQVLGEVFKAGSTSATALGGHTFSSELIGALEEHDIDDITYSELLKDATNQGKIGMLLGPIAIGGAVATKAAQKGITNNMARAATGAGIQIPAFGAEVTTFAGMGAVLDEDVELTGEHFWETAVQLGALKLSHGSTAAGKRLLKPFRKSTAFTPKKAGTGLYELALTDSEFERLGIRGDDPIHFKSKEYIDRIIETDEIRDILKDPNVSLATKAKISWSAFGVETSATTIPTEVNMKDVKGGHEVEIRNELGDLLDAQKYRDKGKAMEDVLDVQKKIEQIGDIKNMRDLDAEGISEFDQRLRDEKIDGIRELDSELMKKDYRDLDANEKATRDKVHKILSEVSSEVVKRKEDAIKEAEQAAEKPKEADRMKEILTELKREDLTKEEKESLADEMDALLYKEPDRGQKDIASEERRAEVDRRVEEAKKHLEEITPEERLTVARHAKEQFEADIVTLKGISERSTSENEKAFVDESIALKEKELVKVDEGIKKLEEEAPPKEEQPAQKPKEKKGMPAEVVTEEGETQRFSVKEQSKQEQSKQEQEALPPKEFAQQTIESRQKIRVGDDIQPSYIYKPPGDKHLTIRRKKNGKWSVYREGSKQNIEPGNKGFPTRKAAEEWLSGKLEEIRTNDLAKIKEQPAQKHKEKKKGIVQDYTPTQTKKLFGDYGVDVVAVSRNPDGSVRVKFSEGDVREFKSSNELFENIAARQTKTHKVDEAVHTLDQIKERGKERAIEFNTGEIKEQPAQKPKEEAAKKEETSKKIKFRPDLSAEKQSKEVASKEVALWEEISKYGDTLDEVIKKIDDTLSDKTTSASEKKKLSSLKEEINDRTSGPEDLNRSVQDEINFWKGLEQEPVRSAERQKEIVEEEAWRDVDVAETVPAGEKKEQPAEKPETLAEIQESTKKIIEEQEGPKPPAPELTTKDQVEVTLGGRTFKDHPIKVKPNGDIVIDHFGLKTIKKKDYKIVGKEEVIEATVEDVKKERGPAESLMASFQGITGYWDAPKKKSGKQKKLEKERDGIIEMLTKDRDEALKSVQDPVEARRIENYYKKQLGRVKKIFSPDKAVAQKLGEETRRDLFHDYIQENRKKLSKVHGDVVPAMMHRLAAANTKAKIRDAFDYIQKVLDKKAEKDEAIKLTEDLEAIDRLTDQGTYTTKKAGETAKIKSNQSPEQVRRMGVLREFLWGKEEGSPNKVPGDITLKPGEVYKYHYDKAKSEGATSDEAAAYARTMKLESKDLVLGENDRLVVETARDEAWREIDEILKNNDSPSPEQLERVENLYLTGLKDMTPEDISFARKALENMSKDGRLLASKQRLARMGDAALDAGDIVGLLKDKKTKVSEDVTDITDKSKKGTILGDLFVLNRNWASFLDKLAFNEIKSSKGKVLPFETSLGKKWDKHLAQPAQIKTNTGVREMMNLKDEAMIEVFEPTLDPALRKTKSKTKHGIRAIAERNAAEEVEIPYRPMTGSLKKGRTKSLKATRNQIVYEWQKMQDPNMWRSLALHSKAPTKRFNVETGKYENSDLGNQIEAAMNPESKLGKELKMEGMKDWANKQLEIYDKSWERYNEVYERMYGIPMPKTKNYVPLFRDVQGGEGFTAQDVILGQSGYSMGTNRHMLSRTRSTKELKHMDAVDVMDSYFYKMEQFRGKGEAIQKLNRVWRNKDVTEAIREKYGEPYVRWLDDFLRDFSGEQSRKVQIKALDLARRNLMIPALAIKPMILIKQITSLPAYSLWLPKGQLTLGSSEWFAQAFGLTGKLKNNQMWKDVVNSDYIKNRYGLGYFDRDLGEIQRLARKSKKTGKFRFDKLRDQVMWGVKAGDRIPIMIGGYATYRYHYKKNIGLGRVKAKEIALREFEAATERAQQASDVTDLGMAQRGGSFMKLATMYMTAPLSYHRIAMGGYRRMKAGAQSGNLEMVTEGARQFVVSHVVLPALFTAVSQGFLFDTKEKKSSMIAKTAAGNTGNLFLVGEIIDHAIDRALGKPFNFQALPAESIGKNTGEATVKVKRIVDKIANEEDVTWEDVQTALSETMDVLSEVAGIPVPGVEGVAGGVVDVAGGEYDFSDPSEIHDAILRILGMSENAIEAGRKKEKKEEGSGVRQKKIYQKPRK